MPLRIYIAIIKSFSKSRIQFHICFLINLFDVDTFCESCNYAPSLDIRQIAFWLAEEGLLLCLVWEQSCAPAAFVQIWALQAETSHGCKSSRAVSFVTWDTCPPASLVKAGRGRLCTWFSVQFVLFSRSFRPPFQESVWTVCDPCFWLGRDSSMSCGWRT